METLTSTKRVISDKSADAQRIINQKTGKTQSKAQESSNPSPTEPAVLPKVVTDLKAQMEALTPEQKKLLLKEVKASKTRTVTRMDAVCTALKEHKPETVQDWIKASNEVFGGENNQESLFCIRYASKVLKAFNIPYPEK